MSRPHVGEMVKALASQPKAAAWLTQEATTLRRLAAEAQDEHERMALELLAVMTPGQRRLLAFRLKSPPRKS